MRVRGLFSQNTQEQYEATQWFRKLLSIGELLLVCESGVVNSHRRAACCVAASWSAVARLICWSSGCAAQLHFTPPRG